MKNKQSKKREEERTDVAQVALGEKQERRRKERKENESGCAKREEGGESIRAQAAQVGERSREELDAVVIEIEHFKQRHRFRELQSRVESRRVE
jgi:hypothetical protein